MTQRKAILYIRVSTDEQAEKGHSLQHQEDRLRNHCAINGIEVLGLYKEDYSAKTFERPEFNKLLAYLRKTIKEIHRDFNKIKVYEMIPCICSVCKTVEYPRHRGQHIRV